MRIKLAEVGSELPLRYAVPFIAIIYAIGLYGFYQVCPSGSECGAGEEPFTFLNNALRTFGLFFSLAEPGHEALRNPWLMTARWIAPLITVFAIFRVFAERFKIWQRQLKLRALQNHNLVVGFGDSARHLLSTSAPMVIIDRAADVFSGVTFSDGRFNIVGDGRETSVLTQARIGKAQSLLIMGGSDSENLDVMAQVSKLREGQVEKLRVAVRLKSADLMAQLNREDAFVATQNLDATAFTLDHVAAQVFLSEHFLFEKAQLRGLARVHLVIVGWSEFALAVLLQFLRNSPFGTLAAPRITVFCKNASATMQFITEKYPVFVESQFVILEIRETANRPTDQQITQCEKYGLVTAIICAHEADETNAVEALALRQRTQILNCWFAPIFVRLKSSVALETMLAGKIGADSDPASAVIAVGQTKRCLSFDHIFELREALAKPIHDAYRQDHHGSSPALKDWGSLPATYRIANMAAAQHSAARIISAGYVITAPSQRLRGDWSIAEPSSAMEHVAELVHRAWEIDRRLDGWRFAEKRDNEKLLHPSLKPYSKLPDEVKDFDRAQLRVLSKVLKKGGGPATVFKDHVVACLGHNSISTEEATLLRAATKVAMGTLLAEHVTLASPLAPGSDSVIVDAALDVLITRKIPYRLLVLQSLPWTIVLDEQAAQRGVTVEELDLARNSILKKAGSAAQIVHLSPSGVTDAKWVQKSAFRIAAYRSANHWMADRAHNVLCHLRDGQSVKPGGTAEAFAEFKKKKTNIHRV
jgi:hypothetical protein